MGVSWCRAGGVDPELCEVLCCCHWWLRWLHVRLWARTYWVVPQHSKDRCRALGTKP